MGRRIEETLGVLNGLLGDYLARTDNGLAIEMSAFHQGLPLPLDPASIAAAHGSTRRRALILVHGVMCTETVFRFPDGSDYGTHLADACDVTPFYVRYNSGRPIVDNGHELATLLARLVEAYPDPLDELILLGYSMGGLVVRRACHVAAQRRMPWLDRVRAAFYVGTPHLGAPAERLGRTVASILRAIPDPYTRLVAEIADLRSAGIKDLGDGHVSGAGASPSLDDARHPLPLLPAIRHHLIAGSLVGDPRIDVLFGDAIVPVASASFAHGWKSGASPLPPHQVAVLPGVSHLGLARHPDVLAQLLRWCKDPA